MNADKIIIKVGDHCFCDDFCDCRPDLTLYINGLGGHGHAVWVTDSRGQMFYQCNFMGFEFQACDAFAAKAELKRRLGNLNFVDIAVY